MYSNRVMITGFVGHDAETHTGRNDSTFTTLSVATKRSWKNRETGAYDSQTTWHKCVVFGPQRDRRETWPLSQTKVSRNRAATQISARSMYRQIMVSLGAASAGSVSLDITQYRADGVLTIGLSAHTAPWKTSRTCERMERSAPDAETPWHASNTRSSSFTAPTGVPVNRAHPGRSALADVLMNLRLINAGGGAFECQRWLFPVHWPRGLDARSAVLLPHVAPLDSTEELVDLLVAEAHAQ